MTAKEIEAARGWIRNALLLSELPTIDKAWAALDALCAAASENSLVGKRVKIRALLRTTVFRGDHESDVAIAVSPREGETVAEFVERVLIKQPRTYSKVEHDWVEIRVEGDDAE